MAPVSRATDPRQFPLRPYSSPRDALGIAPGGDSFLAAEVAARQRPDTMSELLLRDRPCEAAGGRVPRHPVVPEGNEGTAARIETGGVVGDRAIRGAKGTPAAHEPKGVVGNETLFRIQFTGALCLKRLTISGGHAVSDRRHRIS